MVLIFVALISSEDTNRLQATLQDRVLVKNKVASFIITGGQDNIQQVAGQMMVFFTELGFSIPPFAFVGWSRGWTAEDMERNVMKKGRSDKGKVPCFQS